ncbi:glycosyltransferase family 39 protein [Marivita sp. S6314]|uniref:glycosyltransferase family 39 protein n=1 Tax=Marivita sp. S6314 TaxID=2926406 RepID=UPI001FF0E94C|nr:glycosyltransferase family 39 protein [Marivita sp. S6314]MCK0149798.1 glycosyltransferase family 39 protein [Marivita sp. S6314]
MFAIALFLRTYGADYGFFHGDERINDAARVLTGQLVPGQHFYPPFFNYLNAVAIGGLFGFGLLTDMWSGTAEFRQAYFTDPTPFYLAARYLTGFLGALAAPLFYMSARRVGLGVMHAGIVGAFAVVFPLGVFMAHTAKGDTALAVACFAVIWAFLMRLDTDHKQRWNVIIGIMVALAFGFKQSALLLLGPVALAMIFVLARREGMSSALKSFGVSLIVLLVLWPIMNIGILLDIDGFLAFQKIQTVMSVREEDGFGAGLPVTVRLFGDTLLGLNPVLLAIGLVSPIWFLSKSCGLAMRDALVAIWLANGVSTIAISLLVGTRQPEHLFLPNLLLFVFLAAVVLMDILRSYAGWPKIVVAITSCFGFGLMVGATAMVVKQATATPIAVDLADYLAETYPNSRIQSGLALPVPHTMEAQQHEFDRLDGVAARYGIEMPVVAPERIITENTEDALFWVDTPFPMSGLDGDDALTADFPVQPHAWPAQEDEWQLDYWLEDGFDIFIVNHLDYLKNKSRSTLVRNFHAELVERCVLDRVYDARKPLFLEWEITVFDCRSA